MSFEIKCRQCGARFLDPNPHESWCSGACYKRWYIANVNPDWTPVKLPRKKPGTPGGRRSSALYEDDEDAA